MEYHKTALLHCSPFAIARNSVIAAAVVVIVVVVVVIILVVVHSNQRRGWHLKGCQN